jgi:hypothetical protein
MLVISRYIISVICKPCSLRRDIVYSSESLPTFRSNVLRPSSGKNKILFIFTAVRTSSLTVTALCKFTSSGICVGVVGPLFPDVLEDRWSFIFKVQQPRRAFSEGSTILADIEKWLTQTHSVKTQTTWFYSKTAARTWNLVALSCLRFV